MTAYASNERDGTIRAFIAALADARRLVARGEFDEPLPALLDYAAVLLDVIDVQLLEAGLPPESRELSVTGRLRDKFEHLLLALKVSSLRHSAQPG